MNKKWRGLTEQFVIICGIFSVFLIVFGEALVIPSFIQSIGRIHPLLLHFPIVLVCGIIVTEFVRFKNKLSAPWIEDLWIVASAFTGITLILGLLLAQEPGYTGDLLSWHKWSAIALFTLISAFYWLRNTRFYTHLSAKILSLTLAISLILTGHFGANLTHGASYVWEPMQKAQPIKYEDALVFKDMVQPILHAKCEGCHNLEKMKAQLLMIDEKSLLKGGKSGPLFIHGRPDSSRLIERINLLADDKEHMPPIGQPQLSDQDKIILALWIKGNATFTKKVMQLPPSDSLNLIAQKIFSIIDEEAQFDFPAADQKVIDTFSDAYRTISPWAKNSPALRINFFQKNAFRSNKLIELKELKKQIVFLSLAKMPVKDADLSTIANFENLQRLDLNYTDITSKGLNVLQNLSQLKSLSVSGTQMDYASLSASLKGFKFLKSLYVWDTPLSPQDIQLLTQNFKKIQIVGGFKDDGKSPLKLNPPQLNNPTTIFDLQAEIKLFHPIKGVEIRYTTDGTEPDSLNSAVFNGKMSISKNTKIRTKAFKTGWIGSDEIIFDFYACKIRPDSIAVLLPLNRVHQAQAEKSYFDRLLGTFGANSPAWANYWTGVRNNNLEIYMSFKEPKAISTISLRIMEELATGIFPPESVEIWGRNSPTAPFKLVQKTKPIIPKEIRTHLLYTVDVPIKSKVFNELKLIAKPVEEIPEWHNSKGKKALLLVDEILIN